MNIPLLLIVLAALSVGGCAGFSKDGGFNEVAGATRTHLDKDLKWPRTDAERAKVAAEVAELLAQPLSADDAVQVALLNNRGLQASFEELGVSEADLVQSGRLRNPSFDLRHASAAGQYDIEETLSFNVLSLLTLPFAHDIEKQRFAEMQDAIVLSVMRLATETREAFIAAVAARESVDYLRQVVAAAETSAELARSMVAAGNWNNIDESRERIFYADAFRGMSEAKMSEDAAREKLTRLMGLPALATGERPLQLAQHLPELPQNIENLPDVEATILQNRIDLQMQRLKIDELRRSLKLTNATRFVNVLDAGPARVQQGTRQQPYETGYVVTLEVPIFDGGSIGVKRSEAIYAQSVDRFAQAAVDARSQIRQAYGVYRASYDIARYQRDAVVPLRKALAEQSLLRYNASLISIFELLADAREQFLSIDAYNHSVRDFWIAKSELDAALLGNPVP
ncbi:MAG: TolC family protein [Steroidobacteraceae bacterium]